MILLGGIDACRILFGFKAPETKRQYPKRLESFFDFMHLQGSFEEKTVYFYKMVGQKQREWLTDQLLKFLRYQKDRIMRKEIEEPTVSNYFKAIKLFCESPCQCLFIKNKLR